MAVEYTLEQRALRADALLKDTLLTEAFQAVHNQYVTAFMNCAPSDDRGRARYQDALRDLVAVKSHLLAVVAEGELEARRAQEFQKATAIQKITRIF